MHACDSCRVDILKIKPESTYTHTHVIVVMNVGEAFFFLGKQYFILSGHPRMLNSGSSLSHQSASFHPGTA